MGFGLAYYAGGAASGLLVGFAARACTRVGDERLSAERRDRRRRRSRRERRDWRSGWRRRRRAVGTALTANALVMMGRLAEKLERVALAAEEEGIAAPRRNELSIVAVARARGTPTPKANRRSRCARSTPSARTKTQDDMLYR